MKLLELRFKNLNSLAGEWVLDFTVPEYTAEGIFAITGPTGAGKSTLLDAVCLALYGRTPRLPNISKSVNEIMSRRTGECYAQVVFETPDGRYQCHWSQRKAYKKSDGALGEPRHEISEAACGRVITAKKRDVKQQVELLTGMDFDRFTRSMMLAQGGFSAFLSAAPDERSPLLEQITGTQVYSEISKQVHERKRTEEQDLALLISKLEGIVLLTGDERQDLQGQLTQKQNLLDRQQAEADQYNEVLQWFARIHDLEQSVKAVETEHKSLEKEDQAAADQRDRLEKAQKAARLDGLYTQVMGVRQQLETDNKVVETAEKRLPKLQKQFDDKQAKFNDLKNSAAKAVQEIKTGQPLLKTVRELDVKIKEIVRQKEKSDALIEKDKQELSHKAQSKKSLEKRLGQTGEHIKKIESFLSSNSADAGLVTQISGIKERVAELTKNVERIRRLDKELKSAREDLVQAKKKNEAAQKEWAMAMNAADQTRMRSQAITERLNQHLGGRLLREYKAQYEHLQKEMTYLVRIASLEEHRKSLETDRPCPLCGSLAHPFADSVVPEPDDTQKQLDDLADFIRTAEKYEQELEAIRQTQQEEEKHRHEVEKNGLQASHNVQQAKTHLERLSQDLVELQEQHDGQFESLVVMLEPYGIKKRGKISFPSVVNELERRLEAYTGQQEQLQKLTLEQTGFKLELNSLIISVETIEKAIKQEKENNTEIKQILEGFMSRRKELFGVQDPDTWEQEQEQRIEKLEQQKQSAAAAMDKTRQSVEEQKLIIKSSKESIKSHQSRLESLEPQFEEQLAALEFPSEAVFLDCRMDTAAQKQLQTRMKDLDDRRLALETRQKDLKAELEKTKGVQKTTLARDEIQNELADLRDEMKKTGEAVGAIKQKFQDDQKARDRSKEQAGRVEKKRAVFKKWELLHALIGSADGKKFRNFAQGLTFDLVIDYANQHLIHMTDRYLLLRDEEKPLDLNVMDNYQAGEIRSVKNLSGGESFMVSLCLALGLSSMAGRNVRVDSLFLDEGFGTLDDQALDVALQVLSGLHRQGKLIGVISHVKAIKEVIATRITVLPVAGGKSIIQGPGCRRK